MIQPKQSLPETPELSASWIGGRYRIEHPLAEGGMGAVYAATDVRTGKAVVLKRMRAASGKQALALFEREYRTLVGIQHPRIIKVFEYGVDTSGPYYTMELVKGRDLNELAPVPFVDACRYLRDIATCLALLHTRRLLHRDLSPRNVRVTPDGRCKLLDFGALTSFGTAEQVVGTPPCIPPEAVRGAPLDQRADLFAFGALAYYMLTGRHAFAVRRVQHLRKAWDVRPPPPSHFQPEIPKDIDTLVLRLLSLDALARPGTIAEVFERLNLFGSTEPLDETTVDALARSYLAHTEFVGRERELHALQQDVSGLERGRGGSVVIEGPAGVGRSRLLAELALHGKLAGVETVHVDASGHRRSHGAAIALLQSLIEASQAAAHSASMHGAMLAQLDPWLAEQLGVAASAPDSAITGEWKARVQDVLRDVVAAACHAQPLLLIVDNADDADSASLALLSALQRLAPSHSLLLVCAARAQPGVEPAARDVLGSRASHVELHPLKPADTY
ncbi:MAG: serine/threonine-protein kinase, partial [Myxococcales bacterium]|nr:serine/threonine-protein kinase [Myxococcales bacterium]